MKTIGKLSKEYLEQEYKQSILEFKVQSMRMPDGKHVKKWQVWNAVPLRCGATATRMNYTNLQRS